MTVSFENRHEAAFWRECVLVVMEALGRSLSSKPLEALQALQGGDALLIADQQLAGYRERGGGLQALAAEQAQHERTDATLAIMERVAETMNEQNAQRARAIQELEEEDEEEELDPFVVNGNDLGAAGLHLARTMADVVRFAEHALGRPTFPDDLREELQGAIAAWEQAKAQLREASGFDPFGPAEGN